MNLKILLPTEILLDEEVTKVSAEAENGSFTLLPNHIDFVTAIVPGILFFESESTPEVFIAVDEGVLVKCGADVRVSTGRAIRSDDLDSLQQTVEEVFSRLDERERITVGAIAKLEASFARGVYEIGGSSGEAS
ncbi:F0F1 ATP synthase subunit epsilon [Coleofasciculus sp. E2-BRE-01]|uniref:F0F1 ATP synthase subunit epsilon n=1 Tax=Coleofasciculus sp. E2-BRE-01 TaxID=3069524 RepID=UPI003302BF32